MGGSEAGFAQGLVGIVLDGRYRLEAVLGEGGMGAVFRALHLATERKVAVKLLKPHLTQDATALQRFMREARATLKVDSPHAVKVLDFGITPNRDYYIALEYLDGRTVQRELDVDGPFAPARVIHIARQALSALGAAHRSGLVHRDIKPDNLLLMQVGDDPDYAKLLDFGVAKLMEGSASSDQSRMALTAAGMVFGTPEFMSPEQACGHPLDGRSDLYSLAATMFAMLTGCALFEGNSAIEWLTHHARTPPPHLADVQPQLAALPALDELLQRCLAKRPDQRPASAAELDALLATLEPYVAAEGKTAAPSNASMKATLISPSAYISALPSAASAVLEPTAGPSTTGLMREVSGGRRGMYLALGAIAATIAIAAMVALRTPTSRGASIPGDARIVASVPVDAALDAVPPPTHADAAVAAPADAGAPQVRSAPLRPNPAAKQHLDLAEEALRTNNRLRQLAEADLALKADPRNVRAKYLLGDALIKGGDLDRGCGYLAALGHNPLAMSRAAAAKCPAN